MTNIPSTHQIHWLRKLRLKLGVVLVIISCLAAGARSVTAQDNNGECPKCKAKEEMNAAKETMDQANALLSLVGKNHPKYEEYKLNASEAKEAYDAAVEKHKSATHSCSDAPQPDDEPNVIPDPTTNPEPDPTTNPEPDPTTNPEPDPTTNPESNPPEP